MKNNCEINFKVSTFYAKNTEFLHLKGGQHCILGQILTKKGPRWQPTLETIRTVLQGEMSESFLPVYFFFREGWGNSGI